MKLKLPNSKRVTLIYVVILVWILFGLLGISEGADLTDLSLYFSSLGIPLVGYLFAESWKPSNKRIDNSVDYNTENETKI